MNASTFGAQPWESNLENTCRKVFPQGVCVLPHVCETKLPVTRRNCSGKGRSDDSDFVKVGQRKESCSPSLGFEGWVCSNGKKDGQNQIIVLLRIIYAVLNVHLLERGKGKEFLTLLASTHV